VCCLLLIPITNDESDCAPLSACHTADIFLCGGVGDWMYRSLAGIAPASAGYGTVTIAPKVSKTLDPAAVNASVATVRGVVSSSWTRHTAMPCLDGLASVVTMQVVVPVGMLGEVHVPLLGEAASKAVVTVREYRATSSVGSSAPRARIVWGEGSPPSTELSWLRSPPQVQSKAEAETVLLQVVASELELEVKVAC
jgi:hypothetical protein